MAGAFKRWATAQKGHLEQGALGEGVGAAVFGVWMLFKKTLVTVYLTFVSPPPSSPRLGKGLNVKFVFPINSYV